MMRAMVLVLCLAAAGGIAAYTQYSRGDTGEPVYTLPVRPAAAPASGPSAPVAAARPIDPEDKAGLARALQRELKRVGCYGGEINGVWTTSSRLAMRTFVERVNAALPVDNPDPVLLSLVQGHPERACGVACPAGQTAAEGGACLPSAVLARSAREPADARAEVEKPADAMPVAGAAAAVGTAAALTASAPRAAKTDAAKPDAKGATPEWKTSTSGTARPTAENASGPMPPEGMVRDRRPRRSAEAQPQPPKVVRDVLRALGFK
jgi:hypothetical protein